MKNLQTYKSGILSSSNTLPSRGDGSGFVSNSFNKMMGSRSLPSMKELESSSMRMADAASQRDMEEKESMLDIEAKNAGYSGLSDLQMDAAKKRREQKIKDQFSMINQSKNRLSNIGLQ